MKKAKSGSGSAAAKSHAAPTDIDQYLAGVPEPARGTLARVRAMIRSVVPAEATEGISYGIPTFKYKGSLVAFAAFKNHCSLFPMSGSVLLTFKMFSVCKDIFMSSMRPRLLVELSQA
jgi:hypothetical protein